MEIFSGLELPPKKVAYLKFIFQQGSTVKTTDIAAHFRVAPATITRVISELADEGYLDHVPYKGVIMTDMGRSYGTFLLKRHRILSLMLVRNGLSDEQACQEVSRFESYVTRAAVDIMCRAMGHPLQGVCGVITHDDGCMHSESGKASRNPEHPAGVILQ
jgi:Mn-dependent DtxR family transcriptional regulator